MNWTALCRKRVMITAVLGCLLLRLLIGAFDVSLQSSQSNRNVSTAKKSNGITENSSIAKERYDSKYEGDNSLEEIAVSVEDMNMINSKDLKYIPKIFKGPKVTDNIINKFQYDASRALISKEDLEKEAKNPDLQHIKHFLEKNLNKGDDLKNLDESSDPVRKMDPKESGLIKINDNPEKVNKDPNTKVKVRIGGDEIKDLFRDGNKFLKNANKMHLGDQDLKCGGSQLLVITVFSNPHNLEIRSAIRETWGSIVHKSGYKTKLYFVFGQPKPRFHTPDLLSMLESEKKGYRDIIQFDFVDSHENLTYKSIQTLKWMEKRCQNAKYFMKTDEDVFINVPVLLQEINRNDHSRFIMGHLIEKGRPLRDRRMRYFTPKEIFPNEIYPNYMSGTAYVISHDVIHDLNVAIKKTKFFWLEDVYITGMCAKMANVNLIDNRKFNQSDKLKNPCLLHFLISSHGMNAATLRDSWKALNSFPSECGDITSHLLQ